MRNWLIGKYPDAGKDWRQEEKGTTEDEMVGCHHWLDGHVFEQALGVGDGQWGLSCCSPWGRRVRCDWVTELNIYLVWLKLLILSRQSYQTKISNLKTLPIFWLCNFITLRLFLFMDICVSLWLFACAWYILIINAVVMLSKVAMNTEFAEVLLREIQD